jgi:hypothetical protein
MGMGEQRHFRLLLMAKQWTLTVSCVMQALTLITLR